MSANSLKNYFQAKKSWADVFLAVLGVIFQEYHQLKSHYFKQSVKHYFLTILWIAVALILVASFSQNLKSNLIKK